MMYVMQEQIDACDAIINDACNTKMIFWYMDGHSSHSP